MKLGHTHLKIRDLSRSLSFYTDVLELQVNEIIPDRMAFLTFGNMHHDLALQAVGKDAHIPGRWDTGLFHVAFEVEDKQAFARMYIKLKEAGITPFLVDHQISWAMYFSDPDHNGLEIYVDTRLEVAGSMNWSGKDRLLTEGQVLDHFVGSSNT